MKMNFSVLLLVLIFSAFSEGGDKIGHGGGIWACQADPQARLERGMLIDLYEAKVEYQLDPIISNEAPEKIIAARAEFLRQNLPDYAALLEPYLVEVQSKINYVNAIVIPIEDSLFRIRPLPGSCPEGQWNYVQFANFTQQGLVLIQKNLWEESRIPNLDKSALVWHEVIYRWLRVVKGDTNSVRARQIVGLLYSTLAAPEMRSRIESVVNGPGSAPITWFCLSQDFSTRDVYAASAPLKREAELAALATCTGNTRRPCPENWLRCDQLETGPPRHFCEIKDLASNQIYSSRGHSPLEATFEAFKQCKLGAYSYGQCIVDRVKCQ